MFYRFFYILFIVFIFSCSDTKIPETLDGEIWSLQSQVIQISDTTYEKGADGISNPQITLTELPINFRDETWTFANQELKIVTKLQSGNVSEINFKVVNTPEGFILKNENEEDKICKITKRSQNEMVLEAGGIIVLKRKK